MNRHWDKEAYRAFGDALNEVFDRFQNPSAPLSRREFLSELMFLADHYYARIFVMEDVERGIVLGNYRPSLNPMVRFAKLGGETETVSARAVEAGEFDLLPSFPPPVPMSRNDEVYEFVSLCVVKPKPGRNYAT